MLAFWHRLAALEFLDVGNVVVAELDHAVLVVGINPNAGHDRLRRMEVAKNQQVTQWCGRQGALGGEHGGAKEEMKSCEKVGANYI